MKQRDRDSATWVTEPMTDRPSPWRPWVSLGCRHNTVALETASVVLMRNGLASLPFLFRLARATRRTINQNLVLFGLIFNATMLVLSSGGVLTPILGALAHNVGSVAVVLNSSDSVAVLRTNPADTDTLLVTVSWHVVPVQSPPHAWNTWS